MTRPLYARAVRFVLLPLYAFLLVVEATMGSIHDSTGRLTRLFADIAQAIDDSLP
jgi:hypothetical protein